MPSRFWQKLMSLVGAKGKDLSNNLDLKPATINSDQTKEKIVREFKGNSKDGWNISPGLEIHPITISGQKETVEILVESLQRSSDPTKSIREIADLFSEHKLRWIELEECLAQSLPYHTKGEEVPIGDMFDVDKLYSGDVKETATLLFHHFFNVATGRTSLKFIDELRIELEQDGESQEKWRVRVDAANDGSLCKKCESIARKTYPLDQAPLPPFHLGCRCGIGPEHKRASKRKSVKREP
ncbi:hypothetical protein WDW86_14360 [Bdellovibrionota bacterium FG-2]